MRRLLLVASMLSATALSPRVLRTQPPALQQGVTRARGLVEAGNDAGARTLLDSLVGAQPSGTDELAEALYWRAVLDDRATHAERDWKRLVIEAPLSPRAPEALLWLSDLELLRGHPEVARSYLERLLRDSPAAPHRAKAMLWIARSWFQQRDDRRACAAVDSLRATPLAAGELRLQAEEMQGRCAEIAAIAARAAAPATTVDVVDTAAAAPVAAPEPPRKAAPAGRFTVQLAAYGTRAEAEASVRRLAKRGITARVDGTRKPFRVRTGRYASRASAAAALAALRKRGQGGIIAEITP